MMMDNDNVYNFQQMKISIIFHYYFLFISSFPVSRSNAFDAWVKHIQSHKPKWKHSHTARICSDHFAPEDFDCTGQTRRLRPSTIPSNFCNTRRHSTLAIQVLKEHSYNVNSSPASLSRRLSKATEHIKQQNKCIKVLFQRVKRLKKKVQSISEVIDDLKSNNKISENGADMLNLTFGDVPTNILARIKQQNKVGHLLRRKYTAAIRKFALTLNFYLAKAYKYVRETFKLALPHPPMLQS